MCHHSFRAFALSLARVVSYASRATLLIVELLSEDSRGVIYDCNIFIIQVTDVTGSEEGIAVLIT
jgi:hypothetical protein